MWIYIPRLYLKRLSTELFVKMQEATRFGGLKFTTMPCDIQYIR